ncbi:uncharacterized protein EAF01_002318 [Botrytis porri]|uniref:uncharacterized protein n=1 Tax=Botrytis porri TaxID=87229 RepID=UPI0018FF73D1|nr:uncharacterized protein EAF01_002318 [Botrytis porri]KAF7910809.1 hypothetical protein EAF01_002318 [Botrytis porri]
MMSTVDLGPPLVHDRLDSPDLVSHLSTLHITVTILPPSLSPTQPRPASSNVLVASAHMSTRAMRNSISSHCPPTVSHVSSRLGPGFLSVISLGAIYTGLQ